MSPLRTKHVSVDVIHQCMIKLLKVEFHEKVNGFRVYEEQTPFQKYHRLPILVRNGFIP